jgi:hypothetical protein
MNHGADFYSFFPKRHLHLHVKTQQERIMKVTSAVTQTIKGFLLVDSNSAALNTPQQTKMEKKDF